MVFSQDALSFGLKSQQLLAENDKVRVIRFAPQPGDKTPMHSHPDYVVYVIKGGKMKYTLPDGTTTVSELKAGQVLQVFRTGREIKDPATGKVIRRTETAVAGRSHDLPRHFSNRDSLAFFIRRAASVSLI